MADAQSASADLVCRVLPEELQYAACQFCRRLGGGCNGFVFKGALLCGAHVAVKASDLASFQAEIKALGRVGFPGSLVYELASAGVVAFEVVTRGETARRGPPQAFVVAKAQVEHQWPERMADLLITVRRALP